MSGNIAYDRDTLTSQFTQHGNTLYNTPIPTTQNHQGVDPETTQAVKDGDEDTRKRIDDTAKKTDIGREAVAALADKDDESADKFGDSPTPERGDSSGGAQAPAGGSPAGGGMPQMPQAQAPQLTAPTYNIPPELLAQLIQGMQDFQNGGGVADGQGGGGSLAATGPDPLDPNGVLLQKTGLKALNNDQMHQVINQALDLNGVPNDSGVRDKWTQLLVFMAQHESGLNPDAAARSLDDLNVQQSTYTASDGEPNQTSRGLWQTIPSTFATNHVAGTSNNIYDPVASGAAAVHYIMNDPKYRVGADGTGIEEFAANRGMGQGFYRGY